MGGGKLLSCSQVFLEGCKKIKICYNDDVEHHNYGGVFMKEMRAFTLAEVLITLGIIGVVAAMTLPSVISSIRNKHLEVAFKKQSSIISQVLDYMYATGECTTTDCITGFGLYKAYSKLSKTIKVCTASNIDDKLCFTKHSDKMYRDYSKSTNVNSVITDIFDDFQIVLVDSALVTFNASKDSAIIGFDVNGKQKLPNALGHDVFIYKIKNIGNKGVLFPVGEPTDIYNKCNAKGEGRIDAYNGLGCTYKAVKDPDYFKKLPK